MQAANLASSVPAPASNAREAGAEDPPVLELSWLERAHGGETAETLLERVLVQRLVGSVALVSSFGADSAVLLHMVSTIDPATPVVFVDTGKLFEETLAYRDRLVETLGLRDVRSVDPRAGDLAARDPNGERHTFDPDGCCHLRKVMPLESALRPFDAWITGRKRHQSEARARLNRFEHDEAGRIKVNPLADWGQPDVGAYLRRHRLPLHPLLGRGYASVGCAPCTTPVDAGEDARAGRWRGRDKTECGIHLDMGRFVPADRA